jgi:chemotaxis protein methyltransferase CheR
MSEAALPLEDLENVLHDDQAFGALFGFSTAKVSDVFRDPPFYERFREHVVPELSIDPSIKLWVAGCSTGERVYSLAIALTEVGLLDRAIVSATDINAEALGTAKDGVYALDRISGFSTNDFESGGTRSLPHSYRVAHGAAVFDRALVANVVFADHSLATDSVFAEVLVLTCRNVLISFARMLQNPPFGLFKDALCRRGLLGLDAKETVAFSVHAPSFKTIQANESWYQRC